MALFRTGSRDSPEVITGRCWLDPRLDALADQLEQPLPEQLKVQLALGSLAAARNDPERAVLISTAAGERLGAAIGPLRERARFRTGDLTSDADAWALLAATLTASAEAAWRGGADPRPEATRLFLDLSAEADEAGGLALALRPDHPVAAVARLASGRAMGLDLPAWSDRMAVARRARRTLYAAHQQFLQVTSATWFGSHRTMFEFARPLAVHAPVGDPIGALLVTAWCELEAANGDPAEAGADRAADRALVAEAAGRWVAGGPGALMHPYALEAHHAFGTFLAEDPPTFRFHLARTAGRLARVPWSYRRAGEEEYRQALVTALS